MARPIPSEPPFRFHRSIATLGPSPALCDALGDPEHRTWLDDNGQVRYSSRYEQFAQQQTSQGANAHGRQEGETSEAWGPPPPLRERSESNGRIGE